MITTTKAAHTPGSERAARALIELSETTIFSPGATVRIAEIIDRETAAPELLESLEAFVALANFDADTIPKTTEEWDAMVAKAEAAIQKARSGQ